MFLWLMSGVCFGYAALIAADMRNRPAIAWYWSGFLLQPVALALILALPPRHTA